METGPPITFTVARIFCSGANRCQAKTVSCKVAQLVKAPTPLLKVAGPVGSDVDYVIVAHVQACSGQTLSLLCGPLAAFFMSRRVSVLLARHTFKLKRLLQEKPIEAPVVA